MFLGIYDYTVVLTYISLGISVFGITRALEGDFRIAILCLALSGLCDMFDGKIARTKKNRTDDEKSFGIQIDSLCDVVCFGIFPAMICYCLGVKTPAGVAALIFYSIASVIRLAYFNVLEELKHTNPETDQAKGYRGLPITTITIIYPIVYLFHPLVSHETFLLFLAIMHIVVAFLYVLDFKLKKPGNSVIAAMMVLVTAVMVCILFVE